MVRYEDDGMFLHNTQYNIRNLIKNQIHKNRFRFDVIFCGEL
jgi:hypothetical protein